MHLFWAFFHLNRQSAIETLCLLHLFLVYIHLNPHSAIPNPQSNPPIPNPQSPIRNRPPHPLSTARIKYLSLIQ
ncbi:hypothetical protein D1AOALGA4SA_1254 [Olavius algarvensis Delta 1 endosymbiont]|nr:hypothetical protein D1AOALGA4SA_1254 [Olavius algarvensis Delta 1 endosymbiont]